MGRPKIRTPEIIKAQNRERSRRYRTRNKDNPEYWKRTRESERKR